MSELKGAAAPGPRSAGSLRLERRGKASRQGALKLSGEHG
jgi:hypothetical protein